MKHSTFLGLLVSLKESCEYVPETVFTNLLMWLINVSNKARILHSMLERLAGDKRSSLLWPIRKLRRKWSVLNLASLGYEKTKYRRGETIRLGLGF